MPDWGFTILRFIGTPVRWVRGRIRRYGIERQQLVKDGSAVVTPVIQFTKGLGPATVVSGTTEKNRLRLREMSDRWPELRDALMTYANHHPSEAVRKLGAEVEEAVSLDLHNTAWFLESRGSDYLDEIYVESERAHEEALDTTERLMTEIRRY